MALCNYCKLVEIAWHWSGSAWVACIVALDEHGEMIKREVVVDKASGRKAMKPVPDPSMLHFPHANWREGAPRATSECSAWTPSKAAERKAGDGRAKKRRFVPREAAPDAPSVTPAVDTRKVFRTVDMAEMAETLLRPGTVVDGAVRRAGAAIAAAAPIGTADIAAMSAKVAPPEPKRLPEPEELLAPSAIMAWARADKAVRCETIPTRVLLWGPPGTGKTELPWRIAQAHDWHHVYQLMTEETPGTELLGHLIVQGGSTVWCDGTLGRAIRLSHEKHVVFVVDEIARASQDAMSACLLALTNPESLRLTLRSGETLAPNPAHWHVVATSNDEPNVLPPALADRLHIAIHVTSPHPDLVRSLTTEEARRLVCAESREYSVRALLTYDRLVAGGWAQQEAAGLVWEPEVSRSFMDAVRLRHGRR